MEPRIGTVTGIQYTWSGYQKTAIDDVVYATLWDARETKVRTGGRVRYTVQENHHNPWGLPYARILEVLS